MTIREILETNAQNTPDKIFLYYEDITKTYAEIDEIANRVANALLSLNVKRGDNVNVLLTNRPEFIYLMFGLAKIGAVCCPINPALRPDEVQYIVNNSESVALITEDKLMPLVRGIREHIPTVMDVIVADGDGVVCVPREHAEAVASAARKILESDKAGRRKLYEKLGLPPDKTIK